MAHSDQQHHQHVRLEDRDVSPLGETEPLREPVQPHAQVPVSRRRPDLRHLLWYVVGGSLPERYWTWVLHDTTCRTWAIRQLGRPLAMLAPVLAAYLLLMPAPLGLRLITGLTWAAGVMLYMFVNMLVDNDRRAVRAGYASGYVGDLRSHRSDESHHLAVVARRERIAQRRSRRNARSRIG